MENKGCFFTIIGIVAAVTAYVYFFHFTEWGEMRKARNSQVIGLYTSYMKDYPEGKYLAEAEDSIFAIAKRDNRILEYIEVFPQGRYLSQADDVMFDICTDENKSTSSNSFFYRGDKYNLTSYVKTFPKGKHIGEVEKLLQSGDIKTVKMFAKEYQDKPLEDRINQLLWGSESVAWRTANQLDNKDAYAKYLSYYPKGRHRKQAIDNQVKCILGSNHGSMPKMDKIYHTGYSYSSIKVHNNTSYTLTLLYSGPESYRYVISSGKTINITLTNGQYRIAASVNAANVRDYAGSEKLDGSQYEVTYYISSYPGYYR